MSCHLAITPLKLGSLWIIHSWPHRHHALLCSYTYVPHKLGSLPITFQRMGLIQPDEMKSIRGLSLRKSDGFKMVSIASLSAHSEM